MTLDLVLSIAVIVGLLVLSAFFAGSETALTAVSRAHMHHLANEGSHRALHVNSLIANRERLIGVLLLGNTFVNIMASSLATSVLLAFFPQSGVAIVTFGMTAVILIFSEVMPKTLAITRTDRMALTVAAPVRGFVILLGPVVSAVQFLVWQIFRLFGLRRREGVPVLTAQEEIRGAIELHHREGNVEREHLEMLGGVLDLAELEVADVMVHRKNIEMIDGDTPAPQILEHIFSSIHTRFPVWRDDPENIIGVLNAKDVLKALSARRGAREGWDILSLATAPWFVPETTTLEEQLRAFRERGAHFAMVVDEYGTLQGLITLEDILEEVFGNLAETRNLRTRTGIRPQADGSFNVDGAMPVRDLNRELGWDLPEELATTIAGLVIHEARMIPEVGQVFTFFGFTFEVLRRQRNQITALRIRPASPGETEQVA